MSVYLSLCVFLFPSLSSLPAFTVWKLHISVCNTVFACFCLWYDIPLFLSPSVALLVSSVHICNTNICIPHVHPECISVQVHPECIFLSRCILNVSFCPGASWMYLSVQVHPECIFLSRCILNVSFCPGASWMYLSVQVHPECIFLSRCILNVSFCPGASWMYLSIHVCNLI